MSFYDSRRITLDPGLTVLALRGLERRGGHYPFIEPYTRWRRFRISRRALHARVAALFPTLRALLDARATRG
jgi:hypothetical protein